MNLDAALGAPMVAKNIVDAYRDAMQLPSNCAESECSVMSFQELCYAFCVIKEVVRKRDSKIFFCNSFQASVTTKMVKIMESIVALNR